MNSRILAAVVMLLLLSNSAATAQTREMIETVERQLALKRLQGVWAPDLLVTSQGAEAYPLAGRALAFLDGDQFVRLERKRNVASGTFKIEDGFLRLTIVERSPWDLEAPDARQKVQYAFKVDGDLLTLCFSVGDKGKADDLTPGDGRLVVVYKRRGADSRTEVAPPKR